MDLEVVAFDDEQKFAVGRALMAVADQVFDDTKIEPSAYQQDEVIELLSDSENDAGEVAENGDGDDSEFEMFGQMCDPMDSVKQEPPPYTEEVIARTIIEAEIPDAVPNATIDVIDTMAHLPEQPIINSDITLVAGKKFKLTPNAPIQGSYNEIFALDDDDNNYDFTLTTNNDDENGGETSDVDVKEKKCVNLLDVNSDDEDNQPSTSNSNLNGYNLDAFLIYLCPQCGVTCDNIKKWNAHTDIVHNFRSISQLNLKTVINREGQLCYMCNTCNKRFSTESRYGVLLDHRIQHMPIAAYLRCRLCQERFPGRIQFLKHFKKNHKKIGLQKLRRQESIKRHLEFSCPICKEKVDDYDEWNEHLDDEHEWQEKMKEKVTLIRDGFYECNECAVTFRQRHMSCHLLRHEEHKPYRCKLCKTYEGYNMSQMSKHIRVVHLKLGSAGGFRCKYCDQVFTTVTRRITHTMEMHTIEKLKCDVCRKKFNCSSRLITHMAKMNHQKIK